MPRQKPESKLRLGCGSRWLSAKELRNHWTTLERADWSCWPFQVRLCLLHRGAQGCKVVRQLAQSSKPMETHVAPIEFHPVCRRSSDILCHLQRRALDL